MVYTDDEELEKKEGEEVSLDQIDGDMVVRTIYKPEAPTAAISEFKVLLELKGVGSKNGRLGVDLVTVLDISGSMRGERINKMKIAMRFLLKKLGGTDRLSVVTFNRKAARLCPLRKITSNSQNEIIELINNLEARSTTNTQAGLEMALDILKNRIHNEGRRAAIMLLSDGMEDEESHAAKFSADNNDKVPIYTFSLDCDFDPKSLNDIASHGGMFAAVTEVNNLTAAFSLSLAGILSVAIEDLTLTITPSNGYKVTEVEAGIYHRQKVDVDNPVIIRFGSLYDRETRKVLVKLALPEVTEQSGGVEIAYEYRVGGKDTLKSGTKSIYVTGKGISAVEENEEVLAEERRLRTASLMKEAKSLADKKKLEEARAKLVHAKKKLSEGDATLIAQLDQLFHFMVSQETYDTKGHAFVLALEASHGAQRATTFTGDNAFKVRMFNTPLMDQFVEQAVSFNKNPEEYKVPTEEEDRLKVALVY